MAMFGGTNPDSGKHQSSVINLCVVNSVIRPGHRSGFAPRSRNAPSVAPVETPEETTKRHGEEPWPPELY